MSPRENLLYKLYKVASEAILENFSRFVNTTATHARYDGGRGRGGSTGSQK